MTILLFVVIGLKPLMFYSQLAKEKGVIHIKFNFIPLVKVNSMATTLNNIINSSKSSTENVLTPEGNANILGTMDIGINGQKAWKNIKNTIKIFEGDIFF